MDSATTTPPSSSCAAIAAATETVVGSHVLTIDGYTKTTAALAVGESIQSEPFRVGGHGWYIECYPRGEDDGADDWVSVFLYLDRRHSGGGGGGGTGIGIHDDDEVKATHKFTLLDRSGKALLSARSSHVQTFSSNDAAWGSAHFIQRKPLEAYLMIQDDDCCRIRCDVTVVKKEPPPPTAVPPPLNLGDLLLASEVGRDVTFVVGGELFTAHSCVLAAAAQSSSTALMVELLGTGKDEDQSAAAAAVVGSRHVRVDGVAPRVFKALLHFVYTGSVPDDDGDDSRVAVARGLLAAADRYGMERLKMICGDMLRSSLDATTAVETLQLAHKHGCLKLNRACVKFIRGMLDAFSLEETK